MLLNLLLLHYKNSILNKKVFNQFTIITFLGYCILYIIFGNFVLLLGLFDLLYFLYNYIDLVINNDSKNDNKLETKINNNIFKTLVKKIDNQFVKKITIDPEFERDKFKPYKYNLKDTMISLSNNIN